jgi:hypothetical protein
VIPYFNISRLKDIPLSIPGNRDRLSFLKFQESSEDPIRTGTYFGFITGLPIHYAPIYNKETLVKFRPLDKESDITVYDENVKNVKVSYTMKYENEAMLEGDVKTLERSVVNIFMKILNELTVFQTDDGRPMNLYDRMKSVQNMHVGDLRRSDGKIEKTVSGNVDRVIKGLEWPTGAVTAIASGLIIEWEETDQSMPGLTHHIRIFAKTR